MILKVWVHRPSNLVLFDVACKIVEMTVMVLQNKWVPPFSNLFHRFGLCLFEGKQVISQRDLIYHGFCEFWPWYKSDFRVFIICWECISESLQYKCRYVLDYFGDQDKI